MKKRRTKTNKRPFEIDVKLFATEERGITNSVMEVRVKIIILYTVM